MTLLALVSGVASAQSTACTTDAEIEVSTADDQAADASGTGVTDGRSAEVGATAGYDRDEAKVLTTDHRSFDLDGDGARDSGGHGGASLACGPPEEWGLVTGFGCAVLTTL